MAEEEKVAIEDKPKEEAGEKGAEEKGPDPEEERQRRAPRAARMAPAKC